MKTQNATQHPGGEFAALAGSENPVVGNLGSQDRQKVIEALFDELTTSSFAEGCEERIARGLEARTDAQLLALANEKGTWIPKGADSQNIVIAGTPKIP